MHAAKHFDPQLGIDIHTYVYPPLPPFPLPTLHIGIVLDPFDYVPFIGSTVDVSGVKRATAGTGGLDLHIPLGMYVPPPEVPVGPQHTDEIFMGSMTVVADGDPLSRIGMPVLDCNIVGMINPFRLNKPKVPQLSMSLPTALNVAIPNTVFVGGPPMISIMGMAMKGLFAGLGRLKRLKRVESAIEHMKGRWQKFVTEMPEGFVKCKILRAEPVDIRSGSVTVEQVDFSIPGRLPLVWSRRYSSRSGFPGVCGHGWLTPADTHLQVDDDGSVQFRHADGSLAVFERAPDATAEPEVREFLGPACLRHVAGARGPEWHVSADDGLVYAFDAPAHRQAPRLIELARIEDLHGNAWRFERVDGRLVRIVESGHRQDPPRPGRFLELDGQGPHLHRLALHDPLTGISHVLVRYRQDQHGDLVAVADALGAERSFEYRQHRLVRHTDRTGLSFHYAFDDRWRVVRAWGDGGLHDYRFAYDPLLNETEVTDSLGHVSLVKFDARQLPLCEIDPMGGCTSFEYDDHGRTTAVTDPAGLRSEYRYDDCGRLAEWKRPDGSVVGTQFDAQGRVLAVTRPGMGTWTQTWSAQGRLTSQQSPLGARFHYEYDEHGQLRCYTSPRGAVTRLAYDAHGHLRSLTNALGQTQQFEHDGMGQLLRHRDAAGGETRYRLDAKGRIVQAIEPDGSSAKFDFDAEDRPVRYVDRYGGITQLSYAGTGHVRRRVQPDGEAVEYRYDTEEQLVAVVNHRGQSHLFRRDPLGRVVEETDYWGQSRRFEFDAGGRIVRSIDALGRSVTYATDARGRIVKKSWQDPDDGSRLVVETFKYDDAGRLTELRGPSSHVVRRHDLEGRLVAEQQNGFTIENGYDEVGNRVSRRTGAGNHVATAFDLLDRPVRITINDEAPITLDRDASGRMSTERLGPQLVRSRRHDAQGRVAAQSMLLDGAALLETRFEYDTAGQLATRIDAAAGIDRYTYDPLGRVLRHAEQSGKVHEFHPDAAGDLLRTEVRVTEMKQVVGGARMPDDWVREGMHDGNRYRFDRAGQLVARRSEDRPGQPELQLVWDANRRLVRSRWQGGDRDGESTRYGYDGLGRRIFKRQGTRTQWFFWDGDHLLAEVSEEGATSMPSPDGTTGRVVDLIAARGKARAVSELHRSAREYVYRDGGFEPLAVIDRQALAGARTAPPPPAPQATGPGGTAAAVRPASAPAVAADASAQGWGALGSGAGWATPPAAPAARPENRESLQSLSLDGTARLGGLAPLRGADLPPGPTPQPGRTKPQPEPPAAAASSLLFFWTDPNGCPTALLTAAGEVLWSARYAAWGRADEAAGCRTQQPLRLQGQFADAETGLSYNRHRYFDSGIGAFVSPDPLGLRAGENPYLYAPNALQWSDPLGLACIGTGSSKTLASRLKQALGIDSAARHSPYQAHHLIPVELRGHPIFDHFDFMLDGADNGTFLRTLRGDISTFARHQGSHPGYTEAMRSALTRIDDSALSAVEKQAAVKRLQEAVKSALQSGTPLRLDHGGTEDLWNRALSRLGF